MTTAAVYFPLDMGAISVEMEAVDSGTEQRVAALLAKRQGLPLTPGGFLASFVPTGHARQGFSCLSETMMRLVSTPGTPASSKQMFTRTKE